MLPNLPTKSYSGSLKLKAKAELERRKRADEAAKNAPAISLATFVEKTTNHTLDDWQRDLCARLETLADLRGQRWLIHAPPQAGKSIIVSQRFPAWLLTRKPHHRIKLACYNVTHATRFGRIVRDLMQSADFAEMFPNPGLRLPKIASAEEWSTRARLSTRDSQPSFKALGLATGFVGQGADTLILDDPYADPQEAYSPVINAKVHSFWTDTAKPRLNDDTNVVVMFHRYTENDLAGFLMASEPERWKLIRYAAIADGDYIVPDTGESSPDPLGRPEGTPFSPRFSEQWFKERQENGYVWLSQFQGRPTGKDGTFFKVAQLEIVDALPAGLRSCRAWDLAASVQGDYSAGVQVAGPDANGLWYIVDVVRGRWLPDERDAQLRQIAQLDGRNVKIRLAQDPGQAGVDQAQRLTRMLAGFSVTAERVTGAKETRAEGIASQINAGNVRLLKGKWNREFIEELRQFPLGAHDDQVDAMSDGFTALATNNTIQPVRVRGLA